MTAKGINGFAFKDWAGNQGSVSSAPTLRFVMQSNLG
jgi:hypothetical protein